MQTATSYSSVGYVSALTICLHEVLYGFASVSRVKVPAPLVQMLLTTTSNGLQILLVQRSLTCMKLNAL